MNRQRVVITGLGVIAPNGTGINEFSEALKQGRSGVKTVSLMKEKEFRCTIGGKIELTPEYINQFISPTNQMRMSQAMIYSMIASIECFRDAGFSIDPLAPIDELQEPNWEMGCIIGNTNNGVELFLESISDCWKASNIKKMGISTVEKTMTSSISSKVAGLLGLANKVSTNSSACATGTEAIIDAFHHIQSGRATYMLCGGAEGGAPYQWAGFDAMRMINSKYNESPTEASRPFAENGATFVAAEGAGVLMLESLESAEKRGAKIYAEVLAGHSNCGGQRLGGTMTAPNSTAVRRCIQAAIRDAGISGDQIDYINGHLTGTMADPLEVNNWMSALQLTVDNFPFINGTKALIGHGLSAAGAIECVATVLQMKDGFIHRALNSDALHPELQPFRTKIPLETVSHQINYAAKASFGFGDVNSVIIFKNQVPGSKPGNDA